METLVDIRRREFAETLRRRLERAPHMKIVNDAPHGDVLIQCETCELQYEMNRRTFEHVPDISVLEQLADRFIGQHVPTNETARLVHQRIAEERRDRELAENVGAVPPSRLRSGLYWG